MAEPAVRTPPYNSIKWINNGYDRRRHHRTHDDRRRQRDVPRAGGRY